MCHFVDSHLFNAHNESLYGLESALFSEYKGRIYHEFMGLQRNRMATVLLHKIHHIVRASDHNCDICRLDKNLNLIQKNELRQEQIYKLESEDSSKSSSSELIDNSSSDSDESTSEDSNESSSEDSSGDSDEESSGDSDEDSDEWSSGSE